MPAHAVDDIIVIATFFWGPTPGTVPVDIPTPTGGWTPVLGTQLTLLSGGNVRGKMQWFWRRATTSSTPNPGWSRGSNWDSGTDTAWYCRGFTISGCDTAGDPWDQAVASAVYTATNGAFSAVTVSGSERMVVQFALRSDITTFPAAPSGWTAGTSDTNTTGTDGSSQTYRKNNVSASTSADATTTGAAITGGYAFLGISFKPPAAGGTAWDEFPADTFGLTDARTLAQGKTVAEAFGLTDARAFGRAIVRADVFGLTDARTVSLGIKRTIAETFGLTDATQAFRGIPVLIADVFGLTDANARVTGKGVSVADILSLTDARAFARGKSLADGLALTDSRAFVAAYVRVVADTFALTDARLYARLLKLADALGLGDQTNPVLGGQTNWARSLADILLLGDVFSVTGPQVAGEPGSSQRPAGGARLLGRTGGSVSGHPTSAQRGKIGVE